MFWIAGAAAVSITAVFFFRITKVSWVWSLFGGLAAAGIYAALVFLAYYLLDLFIKALIWG